MRCLHCKIRVARKRQLCYACYHTPSIRVLYLVWRDGRVGKHRGLEANNQHEEGFVRPTQASVPVTARPGSEAKLRVLEERAARGEPLWHPLDRVSEDQEACEAGGRVGGGGISRGSVPPSRKGISDSSSGGGSG